MRPCCVSGRNAIFHRWIEKAWVIPPAIAIGGHSSGGEGKGAMALVEFEADGRVAEVPPEAVRFLDTDRVMDELKDAREGDKT